MVYFAIVTTEITLVFVDEGWHCTEPPERLTNATSTIIKVTVGKRSSFSAIAMESARFSTARACAGLGLEAATADDIGGRLD